MEKNIVDMEPVTEDDFRSVTSYKLHYDLYLASSLVDWGLLEFNKFTWDASSRSYKISHMYVGQQDADTLGPRFKIASPDWRYQFGFGHHAISLEESTFALDKGGVTLRLDFFTDGASDLRMDYSEENYGDMEGRTLHFDLKVLDESIRPKALLNITLGDKG